MSRNSKQTEQCQGCGKSITPPARVNVIDDRIVCTPCWHKLDKLREWRGPATQAQLEYAAALGLVFPSDITKAEMSDLLSNRLDFDDESPAPAWLVDRALRFGVELVTGYTGSQQLCIRILAELRDMDLAFALFFTECVARRMSGARHLIDTPAMDAIAKQLVSLPKAMKSIRKYSGNEFAYIAVGDDRARLNTIGFRTTKDFLEAAAFDSVIPQDLIAEKE